MTPVPCILSVWASLSVTLSLLVHRPWPSQTDSNRFGCAGAKALAMLQDCTVLCIVALNLTSHDVSDADAEALALLKDSATLRTLELDLTSNQVGALDAQVQAILKDCTALYSLINS
mmetsp:Transcript_109832/g.190315  ORF Transcript_109832/g.190315 Transcript_109832/m.190315 type:complete len:117 (-) Transcript_109832:187-537(-)